MPPSHDPAVTSTQSPGEDLPGIAHLLGRLPDVVSAATREDALETVVALSCEQLGAEAIVLITAIDETVGVVRASTDARWPHDSLLPLTGVLAAAFEGQICAIGDVSTQPELLQGLPCEGIRSLVAASVSNRTHRGLVLAVHSQVGAFGHDTAQRIELITPILAAALHSVDAWEDRIADLTARATQSEAALATADAHQRVVLNTMHSGLILEDSEGVVQLVNPALFDVLGIEPDPRLMGQSTWDVSRNTAKHFCDPSAFLHNNRPSAEQPVVTDRLELLSGRVLERTGHAVADGNGQLSRLWVFRDITRQEQTAARLRTLRDEAEAARAQVEQADASKTQFLQRLVMEIRTPLNAVLGMTELALDSDLSPETDDLLRTVKSASAQIDHLLSDLLDLAHQQSTETSLPVHRVPTDIGELVESVVEGFGPAARGQGVELSVVIGPSVGQLDTDAGRVRQILTHLVSNAIKFTERGCVRVSASLGMRGLDIDVSDTGSGIAPERHATLFEGITGTPPALCHPLQTTGVGLHRSRRLARALGGDVVLVASSDTGTTFRLILPGQSTPVDAPHLGALRVILADLGAETTHAVASQLRALRCQPGVVPGPEDDALTAIREEFDPATHGTVLVPTHWHEASVALLRQRGHRVIALAEHAASVSEHFDGFLRQPVTRAALCRHLQPTEATAAAPESTSVTRGHVLVVDDDPHSRRILAAHLETLRLQVDVARDGRDAIDRLRGGSYDLVLMDIEMPGLDGLATASAIRGRQDDAPPIIAITAHRGPRLRAACKAAGMTDLLEKPVTRSRLLDTVQAHLAPRARVLLIDDDPLVLKIHKLHVKRAEPSATVHTATSAKEGLALDRSLRPHVVFIDLELGLTAGTEVMTTLRQARAAAGVRPPKLVLLTGHAVEPIREEMLARGFDEVAKKPVGEADWQALLDCTTDEGTDSHSAVLDRLQDELAQAYLDALAEKLRPATTLPELAAIGHRFHGTGSLYGFPEITRLAGLLSTAARSGTAQGAAQFRRDLLTYATTVEWQVTDSSGS